MSHWSEKIKLLSGTNEGIPWNTTNWQLFLIGFFCIFHATLLCHITDYILTSPITSQYIVERNVIVVVICSYIFSGLVSYFFSQQVVQWIRCSIAISFVSALLLCFRLDQGYTAIVYYTLIGNTLFLFGLMIAWRLRDLRSNQVIRCSIVEAIACGPMILLFQASRLSMPIEALMAWNLLLLGALFAITFLPWNRAATVRAPVRAGASRTHIVLIVGLGALICIAFTSAGVCIALAKSIPYGIVILSLSVMLFTFIVARAQKKSAPEPYPSAGRS